MADLHKVMYFIHLTSQHLVYIIDQLLIEFAENTQKNC